MGYLPSNLLVGRIDTPVGTLTGLNIALESRKNAGTYHEGGDVNHDQEGGKRREGYQQHLWNWVFLIVVDLKIKYEYRLKMGQELV